MPADQSNTITWSSSRASYACLPWVGALNSSTMALPANWLVSPPLNHALRAQAVMADGTSCILTAGPPFPGLIAATASKLLAGLNETQSSRVLPWTWADLRISQFRGASATTLSSSTPLGSDKLTKYSHLPFEEGLSNNQLATATRAAKGQEREMSRGRDGRSPTRMRQHQRGYSLLVNTFRINNSEIMKLSG